MKVDLNLANIEAEDLNITLKFESEKGGLILMTMMLMMMILKMMPIMTTKMNMKTICDVINKSGSNDFVNRACYYTKQRTL